MSSSDGYSDYGFVAEYYDHVVPYAARDDVQFFVDCAKGCSGPVLEIGCGTGRVLVPTAQAGVEITGLDRSPYMLAVCQARLDDQADFTRSRARVVEADMRRFEIDEQFGLVTLPFRSFQHLITVEDQMTCLRCIHRHLMDDGRLILDVFNPWLEFLVKDNIGHEGQAEPEFTMPDGRRVVRTHRTLSRDLLHQVLEIELIYTVTHPDGRQERLVHSFSFRYLFRFEAEHLLARCGFELEDVYADYAGTPYGTQYPGELVIVARKIRD